MELCAITAAPSATDKKNFDGSIYYAGGTATGLVNQAKYYCDLVYLPPEATTESELHDLVAVASQTAVSHKAEFTFTTGPSGLAYFEGLPHEPNVSFEHNGQIFEAIETVQVSHERIQNSMLYKVKVVVLYNKTTSRVGQIDENITILA